MRSVAIALGPLAGLTPTLPPFLHLAPSPSPSDAAVKTLLAQIAKDEASRTAAADGRLRGFLDRKPKATTTTAPSA